MEFKSALNEMASRYGLKSLKNHFLFYSIMSDLITQSFYSKRLNSILFEINKRLDVYTVLSTNSLMDARRIFEVDYKAYDYKCTPKEFVDCINPVSELLNPIEFKEYEERKLKKETKVNAINVIKAKEVLKNDNQPEKEMKEKKNVPVNPNSFKRIKVAATCNTLYLFTNTKGVTELLKGNKNDGTLINVPYRIDRNSLNVNIDDRNAIYYLNVPKEKYEFLSVNQIEGDLLICGETNKEEFESSGINIKTDKGKLWIRSKTNHLTISGDDGDVNLNGTYANIALDKTIANIKGELQFKSRKTEHSLYAVTMSGNISIKIAGFNECIGKGIFGKRKSYKGKHYCLNKPLNITLKTYNGEIDVEPKM